MDSTSMTPADFSAMMGNNQCNGSWWIIILFLFAFMGGGFGWNRGGDYGNFATAASQQEILFGQQFQNLDNKLDRLGNGIADATFSLNNTVVNEGRSLQTMGYQNTMAINANINSVDRQIGALTAQTDRQTCAIINAVHQDGEKTRSMFQANEIQTLRDKVFALEADNRMCGVVRYPMSYAYSAGPSPFCNCNCNCNSI